MRANQFVALWVCFVFFVFAPLTHARQNSTALSTTSTQTGYVEIVPAGNSAAPAGAAIFGLRSNSVLVTETGVPFTTTVQSGRIFAEISTLVNTGLALANPTGQDIIVSFFSTDNSGRDSSPSSFTIPANQQVTAFLTNAPFGVASPFTGTLTFNSSGPVAAIGIRSFVNERNEVLLTTVPVTPVGSTNSGNILLIPSSTSTGALTTQSVLINPFDTPLSGTLTFYSQGSKNGSTQPVKITINGSNVSTLNYTVAPRSSFRILLQTGKSPVGSVQITPSGTSALPSSFSIFSYVNNGVTVTTTTDKGIPAATALRTYVESSGSFGQKGSVRTALAILNASSTGVKVQLSLMNLNGTSTSFSTSMNLPGGGQISKLITDFFPKLPSPFSGVLRVTATFPVVTTTMRNRYNERGDLLITDTPPYDESSPALPQTEFPLFVKGGGYSTQLVLLSTGSSQTGSLALVLQNGSVLPSGSVTPGP
jgi:hypothetical protein